MFNLVKLFNNSTEKCKCYDKHDGVLKDSNSFIKTINEWY